jgi:hypothetical protein
VVWSRDGRPIDDTFIQLANGTVRNEIIFRDVSRTFLHSELTCSASNTNLTRPVSVTVHVDMNFAPMMVKIESGGNERKRMVAGRPVEVLCRTAGSRPPPIVTWYLNGNRIEGGQDEVRNDDF